MNIPTIETDRLILRSFLSRDFEAYAKMCAEEGFMKFLAAGQPLSKEETWRNLAFIQGHWSLLGYGIWAVEHKESHELLGRVGLLNPFGWPGLEMCWALSPNHWHQGFATESVKAAIAWTFQHLATDRLISLVHQDNHRSVGVAKRVGESFCETMEFLGKPFQVYEIMRFGS